MRCDGVDSSAGVQAHRLKWEAETPGECWTWTVSGIEGTSGGLCGVRSAPLPQ